MFPRTTQRDRRALKLRSTLIRLLLFLLLAPSLVVLLYRFVDPPLTPLMLIRWSQGEGLDHRALPLSRVSPHLVAAVVAAEDNLFCRHRGFDTDALQNEFDTWLAGERPRGASTISMQTAKNILLWPGRDPMRKVLEAGLTPQIELLWSKPRIMEVYLGIIEMGPGIYGAEAAARRWFRKSASALDPGEAALLAAVLPNPQEWSPIRPNRLVAARAARIRRRAARMGPLLDCLSGAGRLANQERVALRAGGVRTRFNE
jgi:monofunctional glycosyltransferase